MTISTTSVLEEKRDNMTGELEAKRTECGDLLENFMSASPTLEKFQGIPHYLVLGREVGMEEFRKNLEGISR
jgi:hypothetical protein